MRLSTTARALLLAASAFVPSALAQAPPASTPLGQAATEALCARYTTAEHWMQKVVLLLSLDTWWHPSGSTMIVQALRDKDPRLTAFGVEALLRADPALLPAVATTELIDELVVRQSVRANPHLRERVLAALKALVPTADAKDRTAWSSWWNAAKATYAPAPWTARTPPEAQGGSGTSATAQRAFDLYQSGLDIAICIDSTGSMQATIDALGEALAEMVDILDGISPKMRLAIVQYKDYTDLGKAGAKVVQPFTKNIRQARKELAGLRANGGGDLPEAVLGGLTITLDEKMNWQPEANKLVVLIGDAPPHAAETDKAIALVRSAREHGSQTGDKPTTGQQVAPKATPILTSCIGVFLELQGKLREQRGYREFVDSQRRMRDDFAKIAEAGGGTFAEVQFTFTDEKPQEKPKDRAKEKEEQKDAARSIAASATRRIVEHILVLSFGDRFAREMRDFVRIFFEYKDADFIK